MKWIFAAVVVLNLLLAGLIALQQTPQDDFRSREASPQLISLLPENAFSSIAASAPVASAPLTPIAASMPATMPPAAVVAAAVTASAPAALLAKAAKVPEAKVVEAKLCYRWGELTDSQLARARGGVATLRLPAAQISDSVREEKQAGGKAWVYYPPLATQSETQTLIAELKAKGLDSYIVRNEGPYRGYLSLGLFAKEAGAQALVKRLKSLGFDQAQIDARGQRSNKTTISLRALTSAQADKLKAVQQRLLPGIAVQPFSCN
ncbi:SPOR domain-containing protein [Craterilacuibacter sp.]|uniref:SPOR domain-containing protein n=1 Tax=Craterilacuibacter sp. TaxID=2870909 RepID=UPI003F3F4D31